MRFNKVFVLAFSCLFIFLLVSCDNTGKIDKAYSYYREGEYDKALELYQVVLKRRPQDVNALKGMADVKLIQKDYAAAIENYKKATEINPEIAVSDLVSMLTYSNTEVREDATSAISQLNANKDAAISEIIKQLATASQYVKLDYLEALKRIGRDTSFVAADVLPYTDYKYPAIQQKALEALGNMDPEKLKEIGALKKMAAKMNDENQDVAETAVKSMGALKSGAAD